MSNTNDLVNSAATGNLQEFKQRFSGLLAEKSVDFLSARSTEVSRSLVTECDCGCESDLEEVTKLHQDTHKVKKTKYGYQLFIYSPSTGKFIAQGPPHKTKRAAEKDAKKFESVNEMSAKAHYRKFKKKGVVPGIDKKRYPNREKEGLEGPYRSKKSGKIFYYDKKEGKYYDPDSDMFLQVSDVMESVVDSITESANTKMPIDIDIDGQIIHVTPDVAGNLINLHDELNESNQKDMIDMLESDKSSFLNIVKFAQRRQ